MVANQAQASAVQIWNYFRSVVEWVKAVFPTYRTPMKGRNWGSMYYRFNDYNLDLNELEMRIAKINDDDVAYKPGIYDYVLTGDEQLLKSSCMCRFNEGSTI